MQDSKFDVTVIIPFYNDSRTIRRALHSISKQTLLPSEVMIVDDASRDSELEALRVILDDFNELNASLISLPENGGPSVARNFGIDSSTTPYIAFLDSDDSWHKDKLLVQAEIFSSHPNLGILGTHNRFSLGVDRDVEVLPVLEDISIRKQLLKNRFSTSSVVIRNLPEFRFNSDLRYSEDNDLWCRILLSGTDGMVVKNPLTYFFKRLSSGQGASGKYLRMFRGQLQVYSGLRKDRLISAAQYVICLFSSSGRFGIRLLNVGLNRLNIWRLHFRSSSREY